MGLKQIRGSVLAAMMDLDNQITVLDGLTASAAELNKLDGVTASTAELNIVDGLTASTAELNILDGVTASTAELNILDGVTASAAELNKVDGLVNHVLTHSSAGLVMSTGGGSYTGTQVVTCTAMSTVLAVQVTLAEDATATGAFATVTLPDPLDNTFTIKIWKGDFTAADAAKKIEWMAVGVAAVA